MLRPPYDNYDFALRQRDIDALEHLRVMRSDCIASHGRAALREHAIRADLEMVASEFPAHVSDAAANFLLRGHDSNHDGNAAELILGPVSTGGGNLRHNGEKMHIVRHEATSSHSAHALTPTSDILTAAARHVQHMHTSGGTTPERAQFLNLLPESPGLRGIVATHMPARSHRHHPHSHQHPGAAYVRSTPTALTHLQQQQQQQQEAQLRQRQQLAGVVASSRASVAPGSGGAVPSAQMFVVSPPSDIDAGSEGDALEEGHMDYAETRGGRSGDAIGNGIANGVMRRLETSGVSTLSPASQPHHSGRAPAAAVAGRGSAAATGLIAPHLGTGINPPHPSFPNSTAGATMSGSADDVFGHPGAAAAIVLREPSTLLQVPAQRGMMRTLPPDYADGDGAPTVPGSGASYSFDPNVMVAELHHRHDAAAHSTFLHGRESGALRQRHHAPAGLATTNVSLHVMNASQQTVTVNHSAATLPPPQRSPQRSAPKPPLHTGYQPQYHHGGFRGESPPPESPLAHGPPKAVPPPPPRSPQWNAQSGHQLGRQHLVQQQDPRAFSWEVESSGASPNGTMTIEVPVVDRARQPIAAPQVSVPPPQSGAVGRPPPAFSSQGSSGSLQHPSRASLATLTAAGGAAALRPGDAPNTNRHHTASRASIGGLQQYQPPSKPEVPGYLMSDSSTDELPLAATATTVARTLHMDEVPAAAGVRAHGDDYESMPYASAALPTPPSPSAAGSSRAAVKAPQRRLPPPASSPVWRQRGEVVYGSPVGGSDGPGQYHLAETGDSVSPEMPRGITPSPTFFS